LASRSLAISIVGDSKDFERALDRSSAKTQKFGSQLSTLTKAGIAGAAAGGIALVGHQLFASVNAAKDAQAAQARLQQALASSSIGYKAHGAAIDAAIQKTSRLAAIDDEDLSDAFAKLVRTTGDVTKATEGMNLAADIARARNISLEAATKTVERAFMGNVTALKRVGVETVTVNDAQVAVTQKYQELADTVDGKLTPAMTEMLKADMSAAKAKDQHATSLATLESAHRQFAGSAAAYGNTAAGAQEKLSVAFENLQEKIGQKLLPVLERLAQKLVALIDWTEKNWPAFQAAIEPVMNVVRKVIDNVIDRIEAIVAAVQGVIKIIQGIRDGEWGKVWEGIKQVVVEGIGGMIVAMTELPRAILEKLGGKAWDLVSSTFGGIVSGIVGFWQAMPGQVAGAIGDGASKIRDALSEIFDKLPGFVKKILGIDSPSKVFAEIGENIIRGVIVGFERMGPELLDRAKGIATSIGGTVFGALGGHDIGTAALVQGGRYLQSLGFEVGENPEFGGVSPVHAPGSYHYQGRAIDVNWPGGGAAELAHLREIFAMLSDGPHKELMIEDAGTPNQHLHLAMAKGGIVTRPTRALIGEAGPEAVIPLDRGGVGGDLYATFVLQMPDGEAFWKFTKKYALRDLARNGSLGLT
jgi:hypothetical protein